MTAGCNDPNSSTCAARRPPQPHWPRTTWGWRMSDPGGLFSGVFAYGGVDVSDTAWLQAMLDTEAALARALERAGLAAEGAGAAVTAAATAGNFDPGELGRQATLTGNPVPALVSALAGRLPGPAAAAGHEETIMIGRTLLQQAVPVTFGLVAAGWMTGLDEARRSLAAVRHERLAVQFGGAAGTLAPLGTGGPRVAALLAGELGLAEPVLPWHTSRLRITELAAALAGACAAAGKIARDVTLLAQTEVAEVREGAGPDRPGMRRGGSSAMPHKQNPVAAIAVLGCTRQAPGLLAALTASAEQEHQRAAGAWHAEWLPLTRLLQLTGSAAAWCAELLASLEVDAAAMRANLDGAGGLPVAEHVTTVLAPRLGRLAAHDLVAGAAARSRSTGRPFRDELASAIAGSGAGADIGPDEIDAALDPSGYL